MSKIFSKIKSLTAYEMIRNMILSGEALPGTRLVLTELEEKWVSDAALSVMPSCVWTSRDSFRTFLIRGRGDTPAVIPGDGAHLSAAHPG